MQPCWWWVRIAFDLDDTLIPCGARFPTERPHHRALAAVLGTERLREGSTDLLTRIGRAGHELWVYTSSMRSHLHIRSTFAAHRVWLGGVVTQHTHDARVGRRYLKHPPTFGIDVLIDDSIAVADVGRRHDFAVVTIRPDDAGWVETVVDGLASFGCRVG